MAINKKLKKFDTVGDYKNFLVTPDFERPDVSSIGASNIPSDLDVEYNPTQMLFVNTKYYLAPTATTITPIIDTVTNGRIGCWYKQTTASTYTKLNSTDLTFYSAYTQNKILTLTFNTIGTSNLRDDANVEYILSAVSTTSAAITATDNCIQRGLITLSASTFPAAGGAQNVYVKTAAGNPWEITNTNGWLAFSSLTGVGPTTLVVTASTNPLTTDRVGNVNIKYTDVDYITTGSITQEGEAEVFEWDDAEPGAASSLVINIGWDETSVSESYTNTFASLSVNGSASWVTSKGLTSTSSNGAFTATTQQNTNTTSRNYTFDIVSNGNTVATIQIIQAAKPALYFYVGNTAAEATTTACTYANTVPTGSASYTVYYKNNYNTTEINSLTFNYDAMFSSASFVNKATAGTITFTVNENSAGNPQRTGYIRVMSGSTEVARITVTQAAGNNKYFYWGGSGSAATTAVTATSAATSVTTTYRTNYTTLTTGSSTSVITAATLTSGTFTGKFTANSTYVQRTDTVTIYGDGVAVATLTFTQDAAPAPGYYYWGNTGSAATTAVTVTSAATSTTATYRTNYTTLASATTDSWITGATFVSGTFTAKFTANNTTSARTGTITVKGDGSAVATFSITQEAAPYFQWSNSSQSASTTVADTATSVSDTYTTNRTGLTVSASSSYAWVTSASISNPNGHGTFSATLQTNSTTTARTAVYFVKQGSTEVGKFTVTQNGTTPTPTYSITAYTGTSGTATAATVNSGSTIFQVRVYANQAWTGSSNQSWVTLNPTTDTTSGMSMITVSANDSSQRSATLTFTGEHGQIATIAITQEGAYVPPTYSISVYYAGGGYQWSAGTTSNLSNTVKITTVNQGWSGYDAPSWISVSDSSGAGSGDHYVTITCDPAVEDERSYTVRFYGSLVDSDYVDVYQPGTGSTPITYSIITYGSISNAASAGTTDTSCSITTQNQGWSISSQPSWVTVSPSSKSSAGSYNLTITIDENNTSSSRSGTITFAGSVQGTDTISVSQKAGPSAPTYNFYWDDNYSTAITTTQLGSGSSLSTYEYYSKTGYTDIRTSTTPEGWVTIDITSIGVYFTASTQNYDAPARSQTFTIQGKKQDNSWVNVGEITVQQRAGGSAPVTYDFKWDNNSSSKSISLDWDDTSISEDYTNNYSLSSSVPASPSASWISSKNLSSTSSDGRFTASVSQNTSSGSRSTTLSVNQYGTSNAVGTLTVTQSGKPIVEKNLTAITISLGSAPTIPCTGGSVSTGSVSYTVTAYYSDGTDETVSATVTASPSAGRSASSLGATETNSPTSIGNITYSASYTYNGVTKTDSDSVTIYQDANPVTGTTVQSTGTTPTTAVTYTRTGGTVTYSISCSPTSDTVSSSAGSVSVDVTATKNVPTSAYTYNTWYKTSAVTQTLCTGAQIAPTVITGTTIQCGTTSLTRTYLDPIDTGFTVSRNALGWNSYTQTSTGVNISYDAYPATATADRSVTYTFKVTGRTTPTCTYVLTQEKYVPPVTGRTVTFTTNSNVTWENNSHNGCGAATVYYMRCRCMDENWNTVWEAEYDNSEGLSPAANCHYPDGRNWTTSSAYYQNKFEMWVPYGTTSITFHIRFDNIDTHGSGGMPVEDTCTANLTDSVTESTILLPVIVWDNC